MKVINYREVLPITMDNDQVKHVTGRLMIGRQDGASNFCMRLFEMGKDGYTPKHIHDWEHEVFVHSGSGQVYFNDLWHDLSPGSAVFVPPGVEHQFRNSSETPFIFVCLVPSQAPEL